MAKQTFELKHKLTDVRFLCRVVDKNRMGQKAIHPEDGELAASKRLERAGYLVAEPTCFLDKGFTPTKAGFDLAARFMMLLNVDAALRAPR